MDPQRGRGRTILAIISGLLAVGLVLAWWLQRGPGSDQPSTGGPAQGTPSQSSTADRPAASASVAPSSTSAGSLPEGCSASHAPMVPTRITLGRVAKDVPVMSLGLAADGTAAAPPKEQPNTVGWYNKGPRPGSDKGKVVLTAHTYHRGGALGNALYADGGLRPGDVVRVTDATGRTLCYQYTHATKVMVKDYDPNSTVLYDDHGAPMLAIVICWDYEKSTEFWASRVIFYAKPLS